MELAEDQLQLCSLGQTSRIQLKLDTHCKYLEIQTLFKTTPARESPNNIKDHSLIENLISNN